MAGYILEVKDKHTTIINTDLHVHKKEEKILTTLLVLETKRAPTSPCDKL